MGLLLRGRAWAGRSGERAPSPGSCRGCGGREGASGGRAGPDRTGVLRPGGAPGRRCGRPGRGAGGTATMRRRGEGCLSPAPPQLLLLLLGALLRARGKRLPRRPLPRGGAGGSPAAVPGSAAGSLARAENPAPPRRSPARARRAGSPALPCRAPPPRFCPCPVPRPDAGLSPSPCPGRGGPEPAGSPGRPGRGVPRRRGVAPARPGGSRRVPAAHAAAAPHGSLAAAAGAGFVPAVRAPGRAGAGAQVASEAAVPGVSGQPPLRSRNAAAHPPRRAP